MKKIEDITLLLVDNDLSYLELVHFYLELIGIYQVETAHTYDEAIQKVRASHFDLVILEIRLDQKNEDLGIDLVKQLKHLQKDLRIIFLTNFFNEKMYEKARMVRPNGFLSKDLSKLKLLQSIEAAMISTSIEAKEFKEGPSISSNQVFFKIGQTYKVVSLKDISHFYAENKNVFGKVEKRSHLIDISLKVLTEKLYPQFLRVHRAYLVNRKYIDLINYKENIIMLQHDIKIPIGYVYRKSFFSELDIME